MKDYKFLLIVLFFSLSSCGQSKKCDTPELKSNDYVSEITKNVNSNSNEYSYDLFSDSFKNKLKKEELTTFLNGLHNKYGKILSTKMIFNKANQFVYLIEFEKAERQMYIKIGSECKVNTFLVKKFIKPKESNLNLRIPFDTIWYTHWGGNTLKQNRHIKSVRQVGAFDFAIKDKNNSTHKTNGLKNSDYYAWGENIISPCNGTIIKAIDSIKDNKPNQVNNQNPHGNYVLLKCIEADDEFIAMYHFMKNSLKVTEGEVINKGSIIAQCGNSGRSTEPHLHFHIQDSKIDSTAVGVIAKFNNVEVLNKKQIINNYTPEKGDFIKNK